MKKLMIALITSIMWFSSMFTPVLADSSGTEVYVDGIGYVTYLEGEKSEYHEENEAVPCLAEVCGGLSYHKMISTGFGTVDLADGSRYITNESAWQCANCNLVMVTQGDIIWGVMSTIGRWATMSCSYKVNKNGVYIVIPENYGYCSSNSMSGYKFFMAAY